MDFSLFNSIFFEQHKIWTIQQVLSLNKDFYISLLFDYKIRNATFWLTRLQQKLIHNGVKSVMRLV